MKDTVIQKRVLLFTILVSLALFITLIIQNEKLQPLNVAVNNAVVPFGLEYYIAFNMISSLGSIYLVPLVLLIACLVLWKRRKHREALWLLFASVTNYLAVNVIKVLTNVARPEEIQRLIPQSFPSAHASTPFVVFILSYFFLVKQHKKGHVFVILGLVTLITLSRVVLGVHWLMDVLGGLLLAIIWISGVLLLYKK